jgi:hypothetical protein
MCFGNVELDGLNSIFLSIYVTPPLKWGFLFTNFLKNIKYIYGKKKLCP